MVDIKQLEELYLKAKEAYYNSGETIMTDAEFDVLEEKLKASGSDIIKQVGSHKGGTHEHPSKMLSLAKLNVMDSNNMKPQIDDFLKWASSKNSQGNTEYEANNKYDGCSMNLIYEYGKLEQGLTRGDGDSGYDHKYKMSVIAPTTVPTNLRIEVRGEILIPKAKFDKYVQNYAAYGFSKPPANERNFVSGIMSRDTMSINIVKDFIFVAYELRIHDVDGTWKYPTKGKTFDILKQLGFNSTYSPKVIYFKDKNDFKKIYDEFENHRENESIFRLDGMVIKCEEAVRLKLGFNDHDLEWAIAIKFPPKDAITEIVSIDWKTGTTGEVVPTAVMAPLLLDGTTVTRATLFNRAKIFEMGAWPGAKVLVAKAGDIIPQIYKVVTPSTQITPLPTHCPTCGEPLTDDLKHLWCTNEDCLAQITKKIQAGVQTFKFRGIGGATIERLYEAGITRIEDYFNKTKFNKTALIRSGSFVNGRELDLIIEGVNDVEKVTIKQVIESMKLKDTGSSVSEQIANYLSGLPYDFKGLTKSACDNLTNKNSEEYKRLMRYLITLKDNGIEVIFKNQQAAVSNLKTIEMTGEPPKIGSLKHKADWFKYLEGHGFVQGKLDINASYLLTESMSSTSGKMSKADQLRAKGSKVITMTYEDFIKNVIQDPELLFELDKEPVGKAPLVKPTADTFILKKPQQPLF